MRDRRYRRAATLVAVLALVGLEGCITVLPKEKPAQLYRFGAGPTALDTRAAPATQITVRAAPTTFVRAAAGDRILTVSGDETAYIAGARWVTAANALFDDAVTRAFDAHGGQVRLLARDEPAPAAYVLKLAVQDFEVRYDHGRGAAPTVVVRLYAALAGRRTDTSGATRIFQVETPAGSNSVHAITASFDSAVDKVLGDMIAWVDQTAAG